MKVLIKSLGYYFISAFGICLTIKASIGVSSFNSLTVTGTNLLTIPIGTITTFFNIGFLILCLVIDKKRAFKQYALMLVSVMSFGEVINLIYYQVFSQFTVNSYPIRMVLFLAGVFIGGFGTGQILKLNLLKFPIESFCQLLAEKTQFNFTIYRYGIDMICVSLSLILAVTYSLPVVVREGTIISLLLLSGIINWSKNINYGLTL